MGELAIILLAWFVVWLGTRDKSSNRGRRSELDVERGKTHITRDGSYTFNGVRYTKEGVPHYALINDKHGALGEDGYDIYGFDFFGYDREGYDSDGYNRDGYNREGSKRPANRQKQ